MANLQTTTITGYLDLNSTTANTSAAGYLWFDTSEQKIKYSYCNGSGISTCTVNPF